jgi:hypothetical protein
LDDLKRVTGKTNLLFALADASLTTPDGRVRDVVFPVVGEETLRDLVKEWKATGPVFYNTLRDSIRSSYRSHYRQMLPALKALEFRSNNAMYQPIIQGLETVKRYADTKLRYYPSDEQIPLDFVPPLWRDEVVEQDANGNQRVNRITYEITVLDALRDQVRCKEVWIVGADRYRNPDDDVPADFELRREEHHAALKLPLDPDTFIETVRAELDGALRMLNDGMPTNTAVKLTDKAGGWIGLSPLEAQPPPQNIAALKAEIGRDWPMTSLLDILKETDFRLNFTEAFRSVTSHENLERDQLRPRLLLCVHGIGTNTGLQRMNSTADGTTYKDLAYTRRRYFTVENLRNAIATITNGTLRARNPALWGHGTNACASDSKHFGAWDQNLTTQWHLRYGGPAIMIYWHLERKSLCIRSQLKSPSSSEVASMIEGVLHHVTEMSVDRQYVDSHGQSEVAFAFCRLLEGKTRNGLLSTLRTAAKLAPIGYPDRYSIEQTPSDRITFCSKTGFDLRRRSRATARPWGGNTSSVFDWRLPLGNVAGARSRSVPAALDLCTRSSRHRLACLKFRIVSSPLAGRQERPHHPRLQQRCRGLRGVHRQAAARHPPVGSAALRRQPRGRTRHPRTAPAFPQVAALVRHTPGVSAVQRRRRRARTRPRAEAGRTHPHRTPSVRPARRRRRPAARSRPHPPTL